MKGRNQLLMGLKGSFENLTVTRARDKDSIVKGKITQTTDAKTEGQIAIRESFKVIQGDWSNLRPFLKKYVDPSKKTWSSANQLTFACKEKLQETTSKEHKKDADAKEKSLNWILWEKIYTWGSLYDPDIVLDQVTGLDVLTHSADLNLSWNFDPASGIQNGTDELRILKYNVEKSDWQDLATGATRADESKVETITFFKSGLTVIVPFFVSADGKNCTTEYPVCAIQPDGQIIYPGNVEP